MDKEELANTLSNAIIVNDVFAGYLTPKKFLIKGKVFGVGHMLAAVIGFLLLLPLSIGYHQNGYALRSGLIMILIITVLLSAFILSSYGKGKISLIGNYLEKFLYEEESRKIARIVRSFVNPTWQILFGVLFAIPVILMAQPAKQLHDLSLFGKVLVNLSIGYTAFFSATGFFLLIGSYLVMREIRKQKFRLDAVSFIPYQTITLKRIIDEGASLSLIGSAIAGLISLLVVALMLVSIESVYLFWFIPVTGVLLLSWLVLSTPFMFVQGVTSSIIRQGKTSHCERLSSEIGRAYSQVDGKNKETIETIEKLQALYQSVYSSQESVLGWTTFWKYVATFLLTITPTLIGIYIESLTRTP